MPTPPRAIIALLVAISVVAAAMPLSLPTPFGPGDASARAPKAARGAILQQFSSDGHSPIGPGVDHAWGKIVTGSGQQVVHMITVQPGAPGITIEAGLSNDTAVGLERSSSLANRTSVEGHRALAAINGDVWSSGSSGALAAPFGLHIQGGELMIAGSYPRPTFGVDATGKALIGAPVVSTNLITADGGIHPVNRINQRRQAGEYVLYTPRFGSTTDADSSGTEVVLSGVPLPLTATVNTMATVVQVRPANGGNPIDPGTVIITGPSTSFLTSLVAGQTVQLTLSITAGWETVTQAMGGREFLLQNGNTYIYPHPSIADQRHPRTGIGIRPDGGVILVTVDGRDAGYSTGVTDSELAALLQAQGASDAINVDGGGSTAMAVREPGDTYVSVVNRPSDGFERSVANSLLVFSATPTGPLASVTVTPGNQTIYNTRSLDFDVFGQDAAYNPVAFDAGAVAWSVSGATGTFDGNGRFTATSPGSATITATVNGISGTTRLRILADTTPPVALPPLVRLLPGSTLDAKVPVNISWPAAKDVGLGVTDYDLEQNVNAKGWKTLPSGSALNRNAQPLLSRNDNYRYSVRALDGAGNSSAWASSPSFRTVVLSEASSAISFHGGWTRITSPSYDGRAAKSSRTKGATVTYSFVGSAFAWISAKSPVRGSAQVYMDGKHIGTVSTYSTTSTAREMVYTQSWSTIGRHTFKLIVSGTPGHPRVDVDAFVVLASPTITTTAPGPTPSPIPTPTPTPIPTPKPTPSPTPKPSPTPTPTPSPSPSPTPSPTSATSVLVGAGDIASCNLTADTATGKVVAGVAGTVFTAGDNAYESGTASEFANCYDPAWGSFKARTRPVPGNHDYVTANAAGYYSYFGAAAGPASQGWYAYDLGTWRIYAINSNCDAIGGCGAGSPQESWLRADLSANPRQCVAAIWHHPRFSSGGHGNNTDMDTIWRDLVASGAEFVVNGHDHDYERFAPMNETGAVAAVNGTREFVVGTGGASLRSFGNVQGSSEVRNNATFGVIKFILTDTGYSWQFMPIAGKTFTDSGSGTCG